MSAKEITAGRVDDSCLKCDIPRSSSCVPVSLVTYRWMEDWFLVSLQSSTNYPKCWSYEDLIFLGGSHRPSRERYVEAYHVRPTEICLRWNWGLPCQPEKCDYWHTCCHELCLTVFNDDHRVIQHAPRSLCTDHS